jgi:hypothetical protein
MSNTDIKQIVMPIVKLHTILNFIRSTENEIRQETLHFLLLPRKIP